MGMTRTVGVYQRDSPSPDKTYAGPSKFVSRRKRLGPVYLPRQAYGRAPLAIIVRVWIRNEDL